jgi:hypothetical protein
MKTESYDKDWSEKPTYAEIVAFSEETGLKRLVKSRYNFDLGLHWIGVESRINEFHEYKEFKWSNILSDLYREYTILSECPDCVQDWFNHLYDLTLLLGED